jgi:hypothetical protein
MLKQDPGSPDKLSGFYNLYTAFPYKRSAATAHAGAQLAGAQRVLSQQDS